MAEENAAKLRPVVTELPGHLVKVQCISERRPCAHIHINDGGQWKRRNAFHAEPMDIDQVVVIPKDADYHKMLKMRFIVRFASED